MSGERNTRSGKAWRWPLSPETVRAVLSGHGALGIAFAGVIYLVCLTGALTVFTPDLQHWKRARAGDRHAERRRSRSPSPKPRKPPARRHLVAHLSHPGQGRRRAMAYRGNRADQTWAVASDGTLVPLDALERFPAAPARQPASAARPGWLPGG
jgi:hypothetical protein